MPRFAFLLNAESIISPKAKAFSKPLEIPCQQIIRRNENHHFIELQTTTFQAKVSSKTL